MNNELHECIEDLEITQLTDGSMKLKQGFIEPSIVILHPCHLDYLAKVTGYVREDEVERQVQQACARLQDWVALLAAQLTAYAKDDERLRQVVQACVGATKTAGAKMGTPESSAVTASTARNDCGQQLDLTYISPEDTA